MDAVPESRVFRAEAFLDLCGVEQNSDEERRCMGAIKELLREQVGRDLEGYDLGNYDFYFVETARSLATYPSGRKIGWIALPKSENVGAFVNPVYASVEKFELVNTKKGDLDDS